MGTESPPPVGPSQPAPAPSPRSLPGAVLPARPGRARPSAPFPPGSPAAPDLSEKLAPHPARIALFRPGPPLARPDVGARQMWLAGTPSLGADGAGGRRMVPSGGHSALPRLRGRLGTPCSAAVCARSLGPGVHREAPGSGPAARRRGARSWGRREVVTLPRGVRGAERRARGERPAR